MKVSNKGIELIKKYEGLILSPYKCPAGILTIGYGHTSTVKAGMCINKEMAEILLKEDLKTVEKTIKKYVGPALTQNQFDALASFIYNVGSGNFTRSTLLKRLNDEKYNEAADELLRWTKARQPGGMKELPGLVKRRKEERKLFLT